MVKQLLTVLFLALVSARKFSISGFSSGGFFSHQFHVIHSSSIEGAAVLAGGPYYCGLGSELATATACLKHPYLIKFDKILDYANEQSEAGTIDPLSNLAGAKVWIDSGTQDTIVVQGVVNLTAAFYLHFQADVVTQFSIPSEHAWITERYGNPCDYHGKPDINNCDYDAAGEFLKHIYDPKTLKKGEINSDNFYQFDQTPYFDSVRVGLASTGYMYYPAACDKKECRVHFVFHGCGMAYARIGIIFVKESGLAEWAEGSDIIIVFPQIAQDDLENPIGCWDVYGYTGKDYALRTGKQVQAIFNMTQNLPPKQPITSFLIPE